MDRGTEAGRQGGRQGGREDFKGGRSLLSRAQKFCPHRCFQSSHPQLNTYLNLFQVQCNMEHEWLPEESLEGMLANLFLPLIIITALSSRSKF